MNHDLPGRFYTTSGGPSAQRFQQIVKKILKKTKQKSRIGLKRSRVKIIINQRWSIMHVKSVILQMSLSNESLSVTVIDHSGGTVSLPHHKNICNIKKMFFFELH